jgi:hypothetical protein
MLKKESMERKKDIKKYYPAVRWDEFYKQNKEIDLLFLGSSHAYRSFIPEIFNEELNVKSFNLGSSSQSIKTSYFVLKEAKENQPKLKKVILEIYYPMIKEENNFVNAQHNYPYMKSGRVKKEFLKEYELQDKLRIFFPLISSQNEILSILKGLIKQETLEKSETKKIKEKYLSKGFVANYRQNIFDDSVFDLKFKKFKKPNLDYLNKIISFCNENKIELICVTAPFPKRSLEKLDYREINSFYTSYFKSKNIKYIDYNYKNEIFIDEKDFKNIDHLNYYGAEKFSKLVIKDLKK